MRRSTSEKRLSREEERRVRGKTISELRAEAGRIGGEANASKRKQVESICSPARSKRKQVESICSPARSKRKQVEANGAPPAPAPAPTRERSTAAPSACKSGYSTGFKLFYEQYPRKVHKSEAAREYERARKRVASERGLTLDQADSFLRQVAIEFAATPKGQSGQYCPHPATWLKAGAWDDDRADWQSHGTNGNGQAPEPVGTFHPPYRD